MHEQFTTSFNSAIGIIEISGTSDFITEVLFAEEAGETEEVPDILQQCKNELQEYFAGKRQTFSIKVQPEGTVFQKSVWERLCEVGYGDTASYINIANRLQNPGAVRAVGLANGHN